MLTKTISLGALVGLSMGNLFTAKDNLGSIWDDVKKQVDDFDWDQAKDQIDQGIDKAADMYKNGKDKINNIDFEKIQDQVIGKTSEYLEGKNYWEYILDWFENFSIEDFRKDYEAQKEYIENATQLVELLNENDTRDLKCNMRSDLDPTSTFMFAPEESAFLHLENASTASWEGTCFKNIEAELTELDDKSGVQVKFTLSDPRDLTCGDWFLMGNTGMKHLSYYFLHGEKTVTFTYPNEDAIADTAFNGISVYTFCENPFTAFESLLKTAVCFLGGISDNPNIPVVGSHVPKYMEKANQKWLASFGYDLVERDTKKVEIDESLIKSGDFLAITRLDGLDPLIMYGTGSHAGHSTMALRFPDEELYIVESQDGWYWPYHGLQKTKFSEWIELAENASFHVTHMPLSEEKSAQFDVDKAVAFFNQTEGLPYGYHNFLYGWVDTPINNWPPLLPSKLVPIAFSILEKIDPSLVDIFFAQALNKRLGTDGLKIEGLAAEAAKQNMTIQDVMAIVEEDGWIYSGEEPKDGLSYVCSAYVAALYKAAGLFGDVEINATEFTPKDVYSLNFFADSWDRPQQCVEADPDLPWCQLLGTYRQQFPGWNTISPYNNMDEHCESVAPEFKREDGC